MGCFSFLCKSCGKGIKSSSFRGQRCKLFLLKDGKVIQRMTGEYDSYGRVFYSGFNKSKEWIMDWGKVCDLIFSKSVGDGIAAFHEKCYEGRLPKTQSEDDPNQGWGGDGKLMTSISKEEIK